MSQIDTLTFVLKADDKGVEAKLNTIDAKSKSVGKATEALGTNFTKFGNQMRESITQVIPGSDRLLNNLGKIGNALKGVTAGAQQSVTSRLRLNGMPPGGGGASVPRPGVAASLGGAGGGGGSAVATAGMAAAGMAATALAAALAIVTVAAATLTKAFMDGVKSLSDSRKAATEAGVTNTQMAAVEQFAKSMRLDRTDAQNALKEIAKTTQAGWVKSNEFGNIFGKGNEQTEMLKKYGIKTTDGNGELRNATGIFEDIGTKMKGMSRDSAIAFGEFFGMTKDFAAGVYDSKVSLSEFAEANKESIATQAAAMVASKQYEQAQQALTNAWNDFAVKVGGKLLPVVTDLVNLIVDAIPHIEAFGEAMYGQIMMIKDIAVSVFDWFMGMRTKIIDGLFGSGTTQSIDTAISDTVSKAASGIADAYKKGIEYSREYGKRGSDPTDTSNFEREMKKNTSLNAKAANVQLEAANVMKTATAKFGLSLDQYLAMWAATSGKASGLRDSGGMTTAGFRDAYRDVTGQYATPEAAVALYGRGQPMMQQLPQQYAMGMGVTPMGIPRNARGLDRAKEAMDATSAPVGPAASPFGGGKSATPFGRGKGSVGQVTIGDIHINTRSTDPQAINDAVTGSLVDNMKFALNKLNDGQVA